MSAEAAWTCRRCGKAGARFEFEPWPGEVGRRIRAEICGGCWDDWLGLQTRIINEYRLNVLDPGHARTLKEQMEIFLGFRRPDPDEQGA